MNNIGDNNITVSTNDGVTLFTMTAQRSFWVVLTDNTTQGGLWFILNYGSDASGGTAASLAGYGLIPLPQGAEPDNLNVDFATSLQNADFTLAVTNWSQLLLLGGSCTTVTLPVITIPSGGDSDGFFCFIYNNTSAPITIIGDPGTVLINGSNSTFLLPSASCMLQFDGVTNYTTIGLETNAPSQTSILAIELEGDITTYDLSSDELQFDIIFFTNNGTPLTNTVIVFFGLNDNQWVVQNKTQSEFGIILQGGTSISPQGDKYALANGRATSFYVNAAYNTLNAIDMLQAIPNVNGLIPISSYLAESSYGYSTWAGVAVLANSFVNTSDVIPIPDTTLTEIIQLSIAKPNINGYIQLSGVIYLCPSIDALARTSLTIERIIDGGAPENLEYQGSFPIYSVLNGLYRDSDLIPVPINITDYINEIAESVDYIISGYSTVGSANVNLSLDTLTPGISYLTATWFSESAGT
jgi:hypothetical protein